jgi:hypothetical protein
MKLLTQLVVMQVQPPFKLLTVTKTVTAVETAAAVAETATAVAETQAETQQQQQVMPLMQKSHMITMEMACETITKHNE